MPPIIRIRQKNSEQSLRRDGPNPHLSASQAFLKRLANEKPARKFMQNAMSEPANHADCKGRTSPLRPASLTNL